jgi:hypothetical protein
MTGICDRENEIKKGGRRGRGKMSGEFEIVESERKESDGNGSGRKVENEIKGKRNCGLVRGFVGDNNIERVAGSGVCDRE